jgi:ribosome-binding factor A
MANRRLERIAGVIRQSVSATILTRLNDPRIKGLVTVTEVDITADLRQATVFLSISGVDEAAQNLTLRAIRNAAGVFQTALGEALVCRYVPHLRFEADRKFHATLETLRLIEQVRREWDEADKPDGSEQDDQPFEEPRT